MRTTRILFVCKGNTCRSPMSEYYLRACAASLTKLNLEVRSAGVEVRTPQGKADARAVAVMRALGIDISSHETRQFDPKEARMFDLIIAMDKPTLEEVARRCDVSCRKKIHLFGTFIPGKAIEEIPDPYEGSLAEYDQTLTRIKACSAGLIVELTQR